MSAVFTGDNSSITDMVRYYFDLGYRNTEILGFLLAVHHISISVRTLQRILARNNLYRRQRESTLSVVVSEIEKLHRLGYVCNGYRSLWKILNTCCGVRVTQETVRIVLRIMDPDGVRLRKIHRLRRRAYFNCGPNFLIHMDGYDKLLPYGFPIHGAIDGFSRKILWLRLLPSSKNPRYVARLYFDYIKEIGRVPRMIRADAGTENSLVKDIHTLLRYYHDDEAAGVRSFSTGRSTANQRIEALWSCLMRNFTQYWRNLFKDLIDDNIFNNASYDHLQCIRFCFSNVIQKQLDQFCSYWNCHRIRAQRRRDLPSGIPDIMYHQSILLGSGDYTFALPCTEYCYAIPYNNYDDQFLRRVGEVTDMDPHEIPLPQSPEDAVLLFKTLIPHL